MKYSLLFFFLLCSNYAESQLFVNGSFETWGSPTVCEINVTPDNWINYSTGCIALDEANQLLCTSTIPGVASNGNIYARACAGPDWQGGEGLYQNVSNLIPGQPYTLSFDYAGSNLYGGSDSCTWRVFVNDVLITQTPYFSSSQPNWTTFFVNFTASQSTHKIGFRAYFKNPCVTCTGSAGIDNIKFLEAPTHSFSNAANEGIQIFPNPMQQVLSLDNLGKEEVEVYLYDLHGREVIQASGHSRIQLNTSSLSYGVYICVVRKNGQVLCKSIIRKQE